MSRNITLHDFASRPPRSARVLANTYTMEKYLGDLDKLQSQLIGLPCEKAMSLDMILSCLSLVGDNWVYGVSTGGYSTVSSTVA